MGGTATIRADVRLIAATNRVLEDLIQREQFRQDLYYRLNVFPIHIPPLRERRTDILLLADYFAERYSLKTHKNVRRISTPAIDMLMAYHWPGNVRELENCIERAVLLSDDDVIHGHHLPPTLQTAESSGTVPRGTLQRHPGARGKRAPGRGAEIVPRHHGRGRGLPGHHGADHGPARPEVPHPVAPIQGPVAASQNLARKLHRGGNETFWQGGIDANDQLAATPRGFSSPQRWSWLMTAPGLAMFYGGLVRRKNVLSTMMHSFFILCLISVQWVLWGYSLAFGPDVGHFIGNLKWLRLNGVGLTPNPDYAATIPHQLFMVYQMMFAVITPALISGAFAETDRSSPPSRSSPFCGRRWSMTRSPTGCGARTDGCATSVRWTSRGEPSCISPRASRRWSSRWSSASARTSRGSPRRRTT